MEKINEAVLLLILVARKGSQKYARGNKSAQDVPSFVNQPQIVFFRSRDQPVLFPGFISRWREVKTKLKINKKWKLWSFCFLFLKKRFCCHEVSVKLIQQRRLILVLIQKWIKEVLWWFAFNDVWQFSFPFSYWCDVNLTLSYLFYWGEISERKNRAEFTFFVSTRKFRI